MNHNEPVESTGHRSGILAAGNFIVDRVKVIDAYPQQDMLATIRGETVTNGGGPFNVLIDLARLRPGLPLEAVGLVGDDADGGWIRDTCKGHGIDTAQLRTNATTHTSYTDVMSVASTGRRTFFHRPGTNALLDETSFDFSHSRARVFHLAYLMLLDQLDEVDGQGSTSAARVLQAAKQHGLITCADVVSVNHPESRRIVTAAAPHLDVLFLNETEAKHLTGIQLCDSGEVHAERVADAGKHILRLGVTRTVVIHYPAGAVACDRDTGVHAVGSVRLPEPLIAGAVGAGDAFAAGYISAMHDDMSVDDCLGRAVCVAAASLLDITPSAGLKPLADCMQLATEYGLRPIDTPLDHSPSDNIPTPAPSNA